jgi:hypothetical protein
MHERFPPDRVNHAGGFGWTNGLARDPAGKQFDDGRLERPISIRELAFFSTLQIATGLFSYL